MYLVLCSDLGGTGDSYKDYNRRQNHQISVIWQSAKPQPGVRSRIQLRAQAVLPDQQVLSHLCKKVISDGIWAILVIRTMYTEARGTETMVTHVSKWWFNAVSATEAIFTGRTCYGVRSIVPHLIVPRLIGPPLIGIGPPSHCSPSHWSPVSLVATATHFQKKEN